MLMARIPSDGQYVWNPFEWTSGEWLTVHEYAKLNEPASATNGRVTLSINGSVVVDLKNISLATREGATFQGFFFQTFFGGTSESPGLSYIMPNIDVSCR